MTDTATPINRAERITNLDTVRGIAAAAALVVGQLSIESAADLGELWTDENASPSDIVGLTFIVDFGGRALGGLPAVTR